MEAAEAAAEARDVTKRFGGFTAIEQLSLRVPPGISYGLLGPSGCGKTTLIRLLSGLLRPTAGNVSLLDRDPSSSEVRPLIGYMPQTTALYTELTARQNIAFFASIYGMADRARVQQLLDLVELTPRADVAIAQLSGGMRQRTSLACALVHRPRLAFLDEPTVGVDPRLRAAFRSYFKRLNGEGVTIIVTSHIMDEAEHCDRLGMMRDGRLIAEGSPAELLRETGAETMEAAFLHYAGEAPST